MPIEEIRKLYQAAPFLPFIIHLSDGRNIEVVHRDFIMLSPTGRTVICYEPDGLFEIIDPRSVTSLEVRPAPQASSSP